jgi:hypothetical protein
VRPHRPYIYMCARVGVGYIFFFFFFLSSFDFDLITELAQSRRVSDPYDSEYVIVMFICQWWPIGPMGGELGAHFMG